MYHFFTDEKNIMNDRILITGRDVNHIKNVLRMKPGEKIVISDAKGASYCCEIEELCADHVTAAILDGQLGSSELPVRLVLFQGLPKSDKLELIIQKSVELGAYRIVPVEMSRCVVRLDDKKKKSKTERWNAIAESAAKQSGRSIIPEVSVPLSFARALSCAEDCDILLVPYEQSDDVTALRDKLGEMKRGMTVGIFIGPEGGYEPEEVESLKRIGGYPVSLGKRILRTETAGIAALSICMFGAEVIAE